MLRDSKILLAVMLVGFLGLAGLQYSLFTQSVAANIATVAAVNKALATTEPAPSPTVEATASAEPTATASGAQRLRVSPRPTATPEVQE
jgi:hypothetical protein